MRQTGLRAIERKLSLHPFHNQGEVWPDLAHGRRHYEIHDFPREYKFELTSKVRGHERIIPTSGLLLGIFTTYWDGIICDVRLQDGSVERYPVEMNRLWQGVKHDKSGVPQLQPEIARGIYGVANGLWTDVDPKKIVLRTLIAQTEERRRISGLIEPYSNLLPDYLK